jgi:hypothetical protein
MRSARRIVVVTVSSCCALSDDEQIISSCAHTSSALMLNHQRVKSIMACEVVIEKGHALRHHCTAGTVVADERRSMSLL